VSLTSKKYRTIALEARNEGIRVEAIYLPEFPEVSSAYSNSRVAKEGEEAAVPIDGAANERIKSDTQEEEENCEDINRQAQYVSYF
jgi:hypothetical protein